MSVSNEGKWLAVDPVDVPVATAAEQILALRLADVQAALPLATHEPDGEGKHVHQLRVASRRAAAALRAFRSLAPRASRKVGRWLKRLRRAAGPARDADVLLARLHGELDSADRSAAAIISHVRDARAAAQQRLESVGAKASNERRLERVVKKLLKAVAKSDAAEAREDFATFARQCLTAAAEQMTPVDPRTASLAELHQLRIAAKRFRYSIELFSSATDPSLRDETYPLVEELQDRLGALNDRAAAQARWQQWLAELPPGADAAAVARLIIEEHEKAIRLRGEFVDWWTPERRL